MMRMMGIALEGEGNSFVEILLNETLCQGGVVIPKEMVRRVGGVNKRLKAKQKYELILRIAAHSSVKFIENVESIDDEENYVILQDDAEERVALYGWQTDCYVIGKYSEVLRGNGCFEEAINSVLSETEHLGIESSVYRFLELMIGRKDAFYRLDDATRPILIYKGDSICHNVLTVMAEQFGSALERAGEWVEYFDLEKEEVSDVVRYTGQHFKAIIGVQSYMFSIKMLDGVHYLHEHIFGPQYNFYFDHPIWVKEHLQYRADNFYVLTHDVNYLKFAEHYFKQKAILFPPAGIVPPEDLNPERRYDLTFVGTYGDYWEQILWIHQLEREERFLANHFLLVMRRSPELTMEKAFARTLENCGIKLDDDAFIAKLHRVRRTVYCVTSYYRKKVIETLLKAGLQVDVFGDSWYQCPLRKYPNLVCHPNITVEDSLVVWKQSKLSLNVMSWHKAGFTERMADIMLAGAVLVTDDTAYLAEQFDNRDMVIFQLEKLEELPVRIKRLLADDNARKEIAENGRCKTQKNHTWDKRAGQFLELLQSEDERAGGKEYIL